MKRSKVALLVGVSLLTGLVGCAPAEPGTGYAPHADETLVLADTPFASDVPESPAAGVRLKNGTFEVQFCDEYVIDYVILGERNARERAHFEPFIAKTLYSLTLAPQTVVSVSGSDVLILDEPELIPGNQIEVVYFQAAKAGMISAFFEIGDSGLPNDLWQTPAGIFLSDPCG